MKDKLFYEVTRGMVWNDKFLPRGTRIEDGAAPAEQVAIWLRVGSVRSLAPVESAAPEAPAEPPVIYADESDEVKHGNDNNRRKRN